jgi:hypothetical protein
LRSTHISAVRGDHRGPSTTTDATSAAPEGRDLATSASSRALDATGAVADIARGSIRASSASLCPEETPRGPVWRRVVRSGAGVDEDPAWAEQLVVVRLVDEVRRRDRQRCIAEGVAQPSPILDPQRIGAPGWPGQRRKVAAGAEGALEPIRDRPGDVVDQGRTTAEPRRLPRVGAGSVMSGRVERADGEQPDLVRRQAIEAVEECGDALDRVGRAARG